MKKLLFVGCAAFALAFASCSSNKSAEQKAPEADQKQATEQVQAVKEEVKEAVNEVLVALQDKLNVFKAKAEAASKADVPNLLTEAKSISDEIKAASLTDDEKKGLEDTFNAIVEICKSIK